MLRFKNCEETGLAIEFKKPAHWLDRLRGMFAALLLCGLGGFAGVAHAGYAAIVVDPATGRLTGIVTRADLLAVYERPDEDIRGEILHDIIERRLGMAPERFEVTCVGGTVTIRGRLGHRSSALRLAEAIAHVGGVVAVRDHLAYELDDTATEPPSARL